MALSGDDDWLRLGWIVSYPLFAVLAVMIFLSAQKVAAPSRPAPEAIADRVDWQEGFVERVEKVHRGVLASGLGAEVESETPNGASALRWTHRTMTMRVARERHAEIEAIVDGWRQLDSGLTLVSEKMFNGSQVLVGLDGLLTHTVRIYWDDEPAKPRVGLVLTALGDDLRLAREVMELGAPVGVAIRPFRPFSAQVAELARLFERDVLLDWSGEAVERRGFDEALRTVPGAVGVAVAAPVAGEVSEQMRRRGLFSLHPDGDAVAADHVFALPLDGGLEAAFDGVTAQARTGGQAIGVATAAGAEDVQRVRSLIARWKKGKVDVVRVSQLAAKPPPPT